jgi:hypothetical protein
LLLLGGARTAQRKEHTMELPSTSERVPLHTDDDVDRRITERTDRSVAAFARHPDRIDARLEALEHEWDVERTLEANAATASLLGLVLGATVDRRFFVLPAVVAGFLLQHALQGWCPPLPIFRRLGFRTQTEIDEERYALKALRGDFAGLDERDAAAALAAARS